MITKKYNVFYACVFLVLITIGTFNDFQISSYLFNTNSLFGRLLASYGMFPATVLIMVSSFVFMFNTDKLYFKLIGVLLLIGSFYFGIINGYEYNLGLNIIQSSIVSIFVYFIPSIFLYKYLNRNKENLFRLALTIVLVILLQLLIVNIIKLIWLRPRMILIMGESNVGFMPWYVKGKYIGDIKLDLIKSFPSAHTSTAASILLMFLINKKHQIVNYIVIITFILMVGLSRMIVGAHFLTDISFGALITLIVYNVVVKYTYGKDIT